jgi:hypothetical protein
LRALFCLLGKAAISPCDQLLNKLAELQRAAEYLFLGLDTSVDRRLSRRDREVDRFVSHRA